MAAGSLPMKVQDPSGAEDDEQQTQLFATATAAVAAVAVAATAVVSSITICMFQ